MKIGHLTTRRIFQNKSLIALDYLPKLLGVK